MGELPAVVAVVTTGSQSESGGIEMECRSPPGTKPVNPAPATPPTPVTPSCSGSNSPYESYGCDIDCDIDESLLACSPGPHRRAWRARTESSEA